MTQINPFAGSVVQSTQVQRQQADDKDQQARKTEDRAKDASLSGGDRFEHQVESTDALQPIHDDPQRNPHQQQRMPGPHPCAPDDDNENPPSHLDLTA